MDLLSQLSIQPGTAGMLRRFGYSTASPSSLTFPDQPLARRGLCNESSGRYVLILDVVEVAKGVVQGVVRGVSDSATVEDLG